MKYAVEVGSVAMIFYLFKLKIGGSSTTIHTQVS
jgi:hypothetical protein